MSQGKEDETMEIEWWVKFIDNVGRTEINYAGGGNTELEAINYILGCRHVRKIVYVGREYPIPSIPSSRKPIIGQRG